jgi:hypothetical protein
MGLHSFCFLHGWVFMYCFTGLLSCFSISSIFGYVLVVKGTSLAAVPTQLLFSWCPETNLETFEVAYLDSDSSAMCTLGYLSC